MLVNTVGPAINQVHARKTSEHMLVQGEDEVITHLGDEKPAPNIQNLEKSQVF